MSGETQVRTVGYKSIEKINHAIHWFDEFLMSISAWLLPIAFILAVSDIGTNDLFFQHNAILLGGWAVAIAIGLEASLRTLVRRAKIAFKEGDWKAFLTWAFLSVLIFVVSCIALIIFTTEKMLGYTEEQALASTGISPFWYAVGRAILTGTLVVIQGIAAHETKVAPPDTQEQLAQIRHEKTLLPEQMELDALRARRAQQLDTQRVQRGVGVVKAVANEVRKPNGQELPLVAAQYERIVDADEPNDDGDDDPTPPTSPRGPRRGSRTGDMALVPAGPRGPSRQGRPATARVFVPPVIDGMEYARPTGPLGDKRVDAAKEIIAASTGEMKLRELARAINAAVGGESKLSDSNASKIRNVAFVELAQAGMLPAWAEQFVVRTAA